MPALDHDMRSSTGRRRSSAILAALLSCGYVVLSCVWASAGQDPSISAGQEPSTPQTIGIGAGDAISEENRKDLLDKAIAGWDRLEDQYQRASFGGKVTDTRTDAEGKVILDRSSHGSYKALSERSGYRLWEFTTPGESVRRANNVYIHADNKAMILGGDGGQWRVELLGENNDDYHKDAVSRVGLEACWFAYVPWAAWELPLRELVRNEHLVITKVGYDASLAQEIGNIQDEIVEVFFELNRPATDERPNTLTRLKRGILWLNPENYWAVVKAEYHLEKGGSAAVNVTYDRKSDAPGDSPQPVKTVDWTLAGSGGQRHYRMDVESFCTDCAQVKDFQIEAFGLAGLQAAAPPSANTREWKVWLVCAANGALLIALAAWRRRGRAT